MTPEPVDELATRPKATDVEPYGIETIPTHHRHSRPLDLFRITFGGANTFATIILGTLPIAPGLSSWARRSSCSRSSPTPVSSTPPTPAIPATT